MSNVIPLWTVQPEVAKPETIKPGYFAVPDLTAEQQAEYEALNAQWEALGAAYLAGIDSVKSI